MDRVYITLCTVVLLFTGSYGLTDAAPVIRLDMLDSEITVGETFGINVTLEGLNPDDALLAFGFDVDNPLELNIIDAHVGPGFMDDSAFFHGTDMAGSAFPALSGGKDILLATLSLSASSNGTYLLGLNSDLEDPQEGLFTLRDPQANLTASIEVNVVPVPGTLILLGSGLLGLWRLRARPTVVSAKAG